MAQDQQCLYNCADIAGACISPEAKQIIHDFKGCSFQENACTSVDWQTEDKKKAVGSEQQCFLKDTIKGIQNK